MFDETQCDAPLPDGYEGSSGRFQTKSYYTIDPDSTWREYRFGLASYRWFNVPSSLFDDGPEK
jgi:hypothetical protein